MNSVLALTQAVIKGNKNLVEKLISEGCDVNKTTKQHKPALYYADYSTFGVLIQAGANALYQEADNSIINLIINNTKFWKNLEAFCDVKYLIEEWYNLKLTLCD